jgi:PilZ domain-containing protein
MKPDQEPSAQYKPRKSARTSVSTRAHMRHPNWYNVEVRICDVSTGGFMAECSEPVMIGAYVSLDVPGIGPVHAQVRWQLGNRMGGMFLDPISLTRCEWTAVKAAAPEEAAEA